MTAFYWTFGLAMVAFFLLGPWLLYQRQFLIGSATMCVAAVAPTFTQVMLTESDSPATVILALLLLPLPLLLLIGRLTFIALRGLRGALRPLEPRT